MAGGLAPSPQEFPFTPEGRAQYYDAVRSSARQMQMEQMMHMTLAVQADEGARMTAASAAHRERVAFLLLCP